MSWDVWGRVGLMVQQKGNQPMGEGVILSKSLHAVGVDVKCLNHTGRRSHPVFQTGNLLQVVQQVVQATIVSSAQVLDEIAATKYYSFTP